MGSNVHNPIKWNKNTLEGLKATCPSKAALPGTTPAPVWQCSLGDRAAGALQDEMD